MNRIIIKYQAINYLIAMFLILGYCSNFLIAQNSGKLLVKESDYQSWGILSDQQLSTDTKWASFSMRYSIGTDTLFLKNTETYKEHYFLNGKKGAFSNDTKWFAFICDKKLNIFNLTFEETVSISDVKTFKWADDQYLIIHLKNNNLLIINLLNRDQLEFQNIKEFRLNFNKNAIVYIDQNQQGNTVKLLHLIKSKSPETIHHSLNPLMKLKWHKEDDSFMFLEAFNDQNFIEQSHIIYYFNKGILKKFDHRQFKTFPKNGFVSKLTIDRFSDIFISKNNDKVFFPVGTWHQKNDSVSVNNTNKLEIWHYKDLEILPRKANLERTKSVEKLGYWNLKNDDFFQVTSVEHSSYILNNSETYALVYSYFEYLPRWNHHGAFSDFYLIDLENQTKKLFLRKHTIDPELFKSSPCGNYFSYFKDNRWWLYDIKQDQHKNISKHIPELLYTPTYYIKPTSYPVWSVDNKYVLISGQHDIWKINLKNSSTKQLTNGKKKNITYKVYPEYHLSFKENSRNNPTLIISDLNSMLITSIDSISRKTGIHTLKNLQKLKTIDFGDKIISNIKNSDEGHTLLFTVEAFNVPHKLMFYKNGLLQEFYKSNKHHYQYQWGSSRIINYQNEKGESIQAVLCYPVNYDPSKVYPLVANIYEQQTKYYNRFYPPSSYSNDEDIHVDLTLKGYFVLLPDLTYEYENTGISATNCLISAVKQASKIVSVDSTGIGLMGHSFGGYETNFIISQTNLFSAAVSGSGFSDLFSTSLSVMPGYGNKPELEFFEFGQIRMQKPHFYAMDKYIANSPIHQVKSIKTPLLLWTGKDDLRVSWKQSLQLHLALSRMNKENIMLIYPKETHVLNKKNNRKDLHSKILDWFDYHLKHQKPRAWIEKNM